LAEFTVLTEAVRAAVDPRLAPHLQVTGWQDGVLRLALDQPALATRWRFQEPAVRRQLARLPACRGLREIRLALVTRGGRAGRRRQPSTLGQAPLAAIADLAATETHPALRRALEDLLAAAQRARQKGAS
jgi:hypothetical protein